MEYQGGSYRCRGFLTAWSKCTYTTLTPKRTFTKWEIGEECDNDYLVKVKAYVVTMNDCTIIVFRPYACWMALWREKSSEMAREI